jgi:hypothetical protein
MALTGQLSDMSLAELIEFFCNQRKTGRLKIDYPRGHSVFFIKDGELVDAKVGLLSGEEAVYFSLTLPNAAFDFSPEVLPTRRTISQSWTQVVLEGLRRLDEGVSPSEADAFGAWSPSEADVSHMFEQVDRLGAGQSSKEPAQEEAAPELERPAASDEVPLSMMVDGASAGGGGRKKWLVMGVAASLVLVCAVAAIPLSGRLGSKSAASSAPAASQPQAEVPAAPAADEAASSNSSTETSEAAPADAAAAETAAAEDARREAREREARERRDRERRAEERAKKEDEADAGSTSAAVTKPAPLAPVGPKSVRVTVSYDEAGRVTQASVAGSTPGAEAYGGTAVRIARGRRFPAGKAGSTVVTIPVN